MLKRPYYYTMDKKEDYNVIDVNVDKSKDMPNSYISSNKMLSVVGGNIRSIRKMQRITISQLANLAGISEKYLQGVEVGKRNISITNLYKISSSLKVNLDLLFVENKNSANEIISFIESKLKEYSEEDLQYFDTLITDIDKIMDKCHMSTNILNRRKANAEALARREENQQRSSTKASKPL